MCARKPRLVRVSLLVGWRNGARTSNQSLSEVMQTQSYSLITFDTQLKTALMDNLSNFLLYLFCRLPAIQIYIHFIERVRHRNKWTQWFDLLPTTSIHSSFGRALYPVKDGAFYCYCYCAYVLRISRYSDFLSPMLTKYRDIFARFKTIRRK